VNYTSTSYPGVFSISSISGNAKYHFGPAGNYVFSSYPFGNLGRGYNMNTMGGTIHRGGHWNINAGAGIFTVDLGWTGGGNSVCGFRCVYNK